MYKLAIFDLDGTLVDTSRGIVNCYQHIIREFGLIELSDNEIKKFIGQNLLKSIMVNFNVGEGIAQKAALSYRTRYKQKGITEISLYDQLEESLKLIKDHGCKLAIATLKKEEFAIQLFENIGLIQYFDTIRGMSDGDSLTKSNIIDLCINDVGIRDRREAVMVGDSIGDFLGAKESGIDFIAVTYGYGFNKYDHQEGEVQRCDNLIQVAKYIISC